MRLTSSASEDARHRRRMAVNARHAMERANADLLAAAKNVVIRWESGDLASAVHELELAIHAVTFAPGGER